MAPEVIEAEDDKAGYGLSCDIWSLGISIIEMADARPPFHQFHPMRALTLILTSPSPTLANPKKWSKELNAFVSSCLEKNPEMRPTCTELASVRVFSLKRCSHQPSKSNTHRHTSTKSSQHPILKARKSGTFAKKPQSFAEMAEKVGAIREETLKARKKGGQEQSSGMFDLSFSELVMNDDDLV